MNRVSMFILGLFLAVCGAHAQSYTQLCDSLSVLMKSAIAAKDMQEKNALMERFTVRFETAVRQDTSMSCAFDSIPYMGKVASENGFVRLFAWSMPTVWGRYQYYGIVQWRQKDSTHTMLLNDTKRERDSLEQAVFVAPDWYAAIYYQMVAQQINGKDYYLLIGVDFNNSITYKKCVDVLTFEDGRPVFGATVLSDRGTPVKRLIFEYAAEASLFLRYLPSRNMIVFNRLVSQYPGMHENKRFYVPSDIFDGLRFRDGKCEYVEDITLTKEDLKKR